MYTNFKDLQNAYGFDNPEKSRDDLKPDEERNFVEDCFDTYEYLGFSKSFMSPYESMKKFNGLKFTVIERVKDLSEDKDGADLECLPLWRIQLQNGKIITAQPEEICLAEMKNQKEIEINDTMTTVIKMIQNQYQKTSASELDISHLYPESLSPQADTSCTLIALAALIDNDIFPLASETTIQTVITLAINISHQIAVSDEPRFTVYDYLDAILNNSGEKISWDDLNEGLTGTNAKSTFTKLITMAEHKRKVYES